MIDPNGYPSELNELSGMTGTFESFGMFMPQSDLSALQELVRQATFASPAPRVLEIGSWTGRTALAMHDAMLEVRQSPWADFRVFCVDHWKGTDGDFTQKVIGRLGPVAVFETFLGNIGDRLMRTVFPCSGESLAWANIWRVPLDLVFIDASHDYESVKADIAGWIRHVRPGGIICGHDYHEEFPGVMKAADEIQAQRRGKTIWCKEV